MDFPDVSIIVVTYNSADLIRRIGGFDEEFMLYGEDQDLCLRVRRAGSEGAHLGDAVRAALHPHESCLNGANRSRFTDNMIDTDRKQEGVGEIDD